MIRRREFIAGLGAALASWSSLDEPLVMSRHLPTYFEILDIMRRAAPKGF